MNFAIDYTTASEDGGGGCPGCLTQHHLGIEGIFADCHEVGTAGGTSGQVNRTFIAPWMAGVYHLTQTATWWNSCDQFGPPPFVNAPEAAVAVLVVGGPHVPVANTTFSGNIAQAAGGAVALDPGVDLDLIHCTLTANGGLRGGGLNVAAGAGVAWLSSTIIAGNQATVEPDIGGTAQSGGHNLIGSPVVLITPQASDWLDIDPRLGPLLANASLLPSHAPLPASPALDSADPNFSPPTDQRGFPRPQRGSHDTMGSDRGAIEVQPPWIESPSSLWVLEDTRPDPVSFAIGDTETPADVLQVSAVANVPPLFPPGSLVVEGEDGTRFVTLVPAPDENGSAEIELQVTDEHGVSTTAMFAVTVVPVNDPPSFTLRDTRVVALRNSGLTELPGFAAGINAGPPDEAGQQLAFQLNHDNPALFVVPPALSPAGTLSFVVRPEVAGLAHCTVVLTDSGGTDNGGSNQSAPQALVIEVVAPPVIGVQPVAPLWELEPGSPASLSVRADGTAPLAFQWSRNGSDLPDATNAVLHLADLRPADGGDYQVRVFNPWGSVTSRIAALRVGLPLSGPMLLREPQDQEVPLGATLVLTVDAAGEPPLLYQWRRNGTPLTDGDGSDPERLPLLRRGSVSGAQSPTLTLTDFQPADAGLFQVFIENANGVTASRRVRVRPGEVDPLTLADGRPESGVLVTSPAGVRTASTAGFAAIAGPDGVERIIGWLRWRATESGSITFTTAGSAYDTQLGVFPAGSPEQVTLDDDNGGYLTSYVSFNARLGAEYWIAPISLAALSGDVVLSWQTRPEPTPVITAQPESVVARLGETRSFRVTVDSPTAVEYQWRRQGEPLTESEHHRGVREPELIIPDLEPGDIGVYTVVVSNALGQSVVSAPAVLDLAEGEGLPSVASSYKPELLLQQVRRTQGLVALRSMRLMQGQGVSAGTILSDNFRPRGQGSQSQTVVLGGSSRWYDLPVPANGLYTLETADSDFDPVLQVYVYSRTNLADPGTLVASDDNSAPDGRNARVWFQACTRDIYLAVVDGRDGAAGRFNLKWELDQRPAPGQMRWHPIAASAIRDPGYAVVDLAEANGIARIQLVYSGADYCELQPVRTFTATAAGNTPAQVWFPVSPGRPYLVLAEPLPGVPPGQMRLSWAIRPAPTPTVSLTGGRVSVRWRPDGLRLESTASLGRVWLEVPPPQPSRQATPKSRSPGGERTLLPRRARPRPLTTPVGADVRRRRGVAVRL
ncbi:MAG: immunoglobulin domain-containing protein [Verrucomicrobia bacterium]|nr:immunoglobulin domain-containing protein [Verrucomicrobiota bacterium]